jgi:hypothetical protein
MSEAPTDRAAVDGSMSDLPAHPLLLEIATAEDVPHEAILACMRTLPEVAPELLAAIARAAEAPITSQIDLNLVYYGVPILSAAREPRLQAPLLRLLRLPDHTLEELLGGEYITTVPQIAIGAFDGDAQALFDLLCDAHASEYVRMSLFGTVAYLTWLGRIPPETTRAFLHRFDTDRPIPAGDIGWNGWETSIELLGWQEFAPLVEAAYADGRLDTGVSELRLFRQGLAGAAEAAPDDHSRFEREGYGYIEDALDAIAFPAPLLGVLNEARVDDLDDALGDGLNHGLDDGLSGGLHDDPNDAPTDADRMLWPSDVAGTRRNPLRHVGRNDPCPCGSGKKYKRCCLAAEASGSNVGVTQRKDGRA